MKINNIFTSNIYELKNKQQKQFVNFSNSPQLSKYREKTHLSPYNNSYEVAFWGKTNYSENEMSFRNLRRKIANKTHKVIRENSLAEWNYYVDSSRENEQKLSDAFNKYMTVVSDKDDFEALKSIKEKGITDPKLAKSLEELLQDYTENIPHKAEIKALEAQENAVMAIVSNYRGTLDGKDYSNGDLDDILLKETNPEIRRKAYNARKANSGDLIAPELVKLVKSRNKFAKNIGYSDYFSYMTERGFKTSEKELFALLAEMEEKSSVLYEKISGKTAEELSKIFGVAQNDLKPWHYGLEIADSPIIEADKYFKNNDDITRIAFDLYKKMGWDIKSMPITLDLLPRAGKNQHCFCFGIDANKDTRVLANLRPDLYSEETLMHELGHGVYSIGLSSHLPFFKQGVASSALTEAIAMMNEALPVKEGSYIELLGMPKELSERLEVNRLKKSISFIRKCLQLITFEKQMYVNPNQDLSKLWYDLEHKYMNRAIPKHLDNRWASEKIHFVSHPAYYQNYFEAEIMAAHIYEAATKKLGPLTENQKTAEFFRAKVFRFGKSLNATEIIKHLSGKDLSVAAYCEQFGTLFQKML